jgi:hypothetical protein
VFTARYELGLRIPSSRYLTMLSWQRPCYFAFYSVSCTGVIHSGTIRGQTGYFSFACSLLTGKVGARIPALDQCFSYPEKRDLWKRKQSWFLLYCQLSDKIPAIFEGIFENCRGISQILLIYFTSARGTPTDVLWNPVCDTLLWTKQEKRMLVEFGHDWYSCVSGVPRL